jgi:hypothetical protein
MMFLYLLSLAAYFHVAIAFPNGAGSCAPGNEAIMNGPHRIPVTLTGTGPISDNDYSVIVGTKTLSETATNSLDANIELNIMLKAKGADDFRGFLLRLGKNDGTSTIGMITSVDGSAQVSSICTDEYGVGGLTHTNGRLDKSMISGKIDLGGETGLYTLDVTVVTNTDASSSTAEWYFSSFTLNATDTPEPPTTTFAPTLAPTPTPPICGALHSVCSSDSDCCSQRCGLFVATGDGQCLFDPSKGSLLSKAAQKLSADNLGGAGGRVTKGN